MNNRQTDTKKNGWFLYFCSFTVCLIMVSTGCNAVWTSPVIPQLKSNDTEINPLGYPITPYKESVIASASLIGFLMGALLSGRFPDIYGRKNIIIFAYILMALSFIALAYARTFFLYYTLRYLLGVAMGVSVAVVPLYLYEITESHNRGRFSNFMGLFITIGCLYGYIIGTCFTVKVFTLFCALPVIVSLPFLIFVIPDSPVYLLSKGDNDKAEKALKLLRYNNCDVHDALDEIRSNLDVSVKAKGVGGFFSLLKDQGVRRACIVSIGMNLFQQFSGISALAAFIGPIFTSAGIAGDTTVFLIGSVQILSCLLASIILDKFPRRLILLATILTSAVCHFIMVLYFCAKSNGYDVGNVHWLPGIAMMVYFFSYSLGIGPLPVIITAEIFPNDVKSIAMSINTFFNGLFSLLLIFSCPLIIEYMGTIWFYAILALSCVLGSIFVYFVVPETKGKTAGEIQKQINS